MRRAHGIPQGQKNHNQRKADKIQHNNDQAILYSSYDDAPELCICFCLALFSFNMASALCFVTERSRALT